MNSTIERRDAHIIVPGPARARLHVPGLWKPGDPIDDMPAIGGGAVSLNWYGNAVAQAFGSTSAGASPNIDFLSDTLKVMLCTSTYTPNQDTDIFKSAVTNEVSGTGYSAGGATLGSPTLAYASKVTTFGGATVSWSTATITARYAVLYDSTPASDATRPLICYVNFGIDYVSTAGTFQITWTGGAIVTLTVA